MSDSHAGNRVTPRSATGNIIFTITPQRVAHRNRGIRRVTILAPLPDIAVDVIESDGIGEAQLHCFTDRT